MIAVVGAGSCDGDTAERAHRVGRLLAQRGAVVVTGGGGGVMEAAARGVRDGRGTVVGVLPGDSRRDGNQYLSIAIATGMGEARNAVIARTCDAMIAVGGEYGTLSEMALALKMGKRVVSLGSWDVDERILRVSSPEQAVGAAMEGARG